MTKVQKSDWRTKLGLVLETGASISARDSFVSKRETQEFKEVCRNLNKEQIEAAFKRFDQTGEISNFNTFHYYWQNLKIA